MLANYIYFQTPKIKSESQRIIPELMPLSSQMTEGHFRPRDRNIKIISTANNAPQELIKVKAPRSNGLPEISYKNNPLVVCRHQRIGVVQAATSARRQSIYALFK